MSQRIRLSQHKSEPSQASEPIIEDEEAKKEQEAKNDKLLHELMVLKFRIKMTKDLYKVNMKGTSVLTKKLNSVYQKKLKKYCENNNGIFDTDLIKQELNIKLDELNDELRKMTCSSSSPKV